MNQIKLIAIDDENSRFALELETLYLEAFPDSERKPISAIYQHAKQGASDVFAVVDESEQFVGLSINLRGKQTILLEYLAISPQARNKHYGSKVLQLLRHNYEGYTLCLEIEQVPNEAQEADLRKRRRLFYERNGYYYLDQAIQYFDIQLDLMATNYELDWSDYQLAYQLNYGPEIDKCVYLLD